MKLDKNLINNYIKDKKELKFILYFKEKKKDLINKKFKYDSLKYKIIKDIKNKVQQKIM